MRLCFALLFTAIAVAFMGIAARTSSLAVAIVCIALAAVAATDAERAWRHWWA